MAILYNQGVLVRKIAWRLRNSRRAPPISILLSAQPRRVRSLSQKVEIFSKDTAFSVTSVCDEH